MTDLGWFRFGQRSRPSSAPRSPTPSDRNPGRESQTGDGRPVSSRVSSHLNLANRPSSSAEPTPPSEDASPNLFFREQDKIWHNPSLDQMVESLQVAVMTRGVLRPIPIEYNTIVLHLIEGYADAQQKIRQADAARADLQESINQHYEEIRQTAEEWSDREKAYKAEVKRLEVLLSRTSQDGLEAVTLARTNSVVDRNGPEAKQFASRLKRLSKHVNQGTSTADDSVGGTKPTRAPRLVTDSTDDPAPAPVAYSQQSVALPRILEQENDIIMSDRLRRNDATLRQLVSYVVDSRDRSEKVTATTILAPPEVLTSREGHCVSSADDLSKAHRGSPDGPTTDQKVVQGQAPSKVPGNQDVTMLNDNDESRVSAFSFEPGDDIFSTLASCDSKDWRSDEAGTVKIPGTLKWQYRHGQVPEQRLEDSQKAPDILPTRDPGNLTASITAQPTPPNGIRTWSVPGDSLNLQDLAHSIKAATTGPRRSHQAAKYDSDSKRDTLVRTPSYLSSPSPGYGTDSIAERNITPKEQDQINARIAATRAVERCSGNTNSNRNK